MIEPRLLGDRYELGDVLGRGGMAEVRRGRDRRLGRTVAIKMLRTDLATDPTFQVRFRREAQSAAMLNHPSIVAVYDTGEDILDGARVPFIVMEFVEGKTLRELLQEHPRITPERALEITSGILDALDYSHRAGIVHRDIKPGNVMITANGDVKVMDFGIARALSDVGATVTQTAAVVGTAQYLSPEQARGETADARSDLYSTGCVLYELLTGRPPFLGDSLVSVAISHVREAATPPSQVDPAVPPAVDAIVMKALAKDRLERYQSAAEMKADVQRAMAGLPVAAEATTTFLPPVPAAVGGGDTTMGYGDSALPIEEEEAAAGGRSQRHDRRGIGYGALAAAVILVLLAAGALGWALFRDTGPQEIRVPSVVNQDVASAQTELEERGLELGTQTQQADPNIAVGLIITPGPGGPGAARGGRRGQRRGLDRRAAGPGAARSDRDAVQRSPAGHPGRRLAHRLGHDRRGERRTGQRGDGNRSGPRHRGRDRHTGQHHDLRRAGGDTQRRRPGPRGRPGNSDGRRVRGPRTAGDRHRGAARHGLRAGPAGWGTAPGRLARGHPRCPGTTGDPVTVTHPNHRP